MTAPRPFVVAGLAPRRTAARALAPMALLAAAACASSTSSSMMGAAAPAPAMTAAMRVPSPDPRVGLKAGWFDAGEAAWNMKVVSKTKPSKDFLNMDAPGDRRLVNSDLAFSGNYAFQGNYSGYQVWDISNPMQPVFTTSYVCPGSQNDVTIYKNLLFTSAEATTGRTDCGIQGVSDTVSAVRARGIRIFDISNMMAPKYLTTVQTCRGSHTNTLVTDPNDSQNVYIYVSGSAGVRSPSELAGCNDKAFEEDRTTALFRIEVIQVPLANPAAARIVSSPRIFADEQGNAEGLKGVVRHAETDPEIVRATARRDSAMRAAGRTPRPARGLTQCHDITVYPAVGLAGGACEGMGLLLDIRDVKNPKRITQAADSNFSYWHSATFNNDGDKVLFSDEWGGGSAARCRATDKPEWGADAIFAIKDRKALEFKSYYKIPANQTPFENCVSHNGSLVPVPGRDILVQSFYQGGITLLDWTDAAKPVEIAFYDQGPMDATKLVSGGYWSAYWYNGYIYGSDMSRGFDVFELTPNAWLTQNEIDAAKLVKHEYLNVQEQPKLVWPAAFVVARAYLDQLVRNRGLAENRTLAIDAALRAAEAQQGAARTAGLTSLATALEQDLQTAADPAKVKLLHGVVKELSAK